MKSTQSRSSCPIGLTLDVVGDKWSLLIVRNIMFAGRKTYKELSEAPEPIATNILAERLKRLEEVGILHKLADPYDGRKHIFVLSEKGFDLMPVLLAMISWGTKYYDSASYPKELVDDVVLHKDDMLRHIRERDLASS